jgi:hypothetical protein
LVARRDFKEKFQRFLPKSDDSNGKGPDPSSTRGPHQASDVTSLLRPRLVLFPLLLFSVCVLASFTRWETRLTTAEDRIVSLTSHDAKADGREIAAAIEKKLTTIAEGTSMTSALSSPCCSIAIPSPLTNRPFDSQANLLTKNTIPSTTALLHCAPATSVR